MARSGVMAEPKQKPGRSKQDYGTPREFLDAVERRFGKVAWDLAAHEGNAVVGHYYGPGSDFAADSLGPEADWDFVGDCYPDGVLWLNPQFGETARWVSRCAAYGGKAALCVLTPASVGTEWFNSFVHGRAIVYALRPRLTFVGCKDPYSKDLMLSVYGRGTGFQTWKWK